jgi:uncharacterized membrane protein YgaE (UPF0421/DUF939 family)
VADGLVGRGEEGVSLSLSLSVGVGVSVGVSLSVGVGVWVWVLVWVTLVPVVMDLFPLAGAYSFCSGIALFSAPKEFPVKICLSFHHMS